MIFVPGRFLIYLYNQVGRGDVARQSAEVDSPFLVGLQLWILVVIQRDARQSPRDGCRVTGVDLLEYDWKEKERCGRTAKKRAEGGEKEVRKKKEKERKGGRDTG